jgi:hypothetical protein
MDLTRNHCQRSRACSRVKLVDNRLLLSLQSLYTIKEHSYCRQKLRVAHQHGENMLPCEEFPQSWTLKLSGTAYRQVSLGKVSRKFQNTKRCRLNLLQDISLSKLNLCASPSELKSAFPLSRSIRQGILAITSPKCQVGHYTL